MYNYAMLLLQVSNVGVISFRQPFRNGNGRPFPLSTDDILIAPFWDTLIGYGGEVYYRYSTNNTLLRHFGVIVRDTIGGHFSPGLLFIATWNGVPKLYLLPDHYTDLVRIMA